MARYGQLRDARGRFARSGRSAIGFARKHKKLLGTGLVAGSMIYAGSRYGGYKRGFRTGFDRGYQKGNLVSFHTRREAYRRGWNSAVTHGRKTGNILPSAPRKSTSGRIKLNPRMRAR